MACLVISITMSQGAFDITMDEDNPEYNENGRWPFQQFVDQLILDMFDPSKLIWSLLCHIVVLICLLLTCLTFCCILVWEVRHGTIMALREILMHQGACAGVYFPDLSSPSAILDGKTNFDSLKMVHGIDLNEDVPHEHLEPALKRHKKEPNPSKFSYLDYDTEMVNGDSSSKTEADLSNMPTVSTGELSSAHVKVEPELCVDDSTDPSKGDSSCKPLPEKLNSISNPSSLMHVPENPKFMKLMKLAKYSYMKNWEFLQDCAIRFLCVLSLDRYASLEFQIYG